MASRTKPVVSMREYDRLRIREKRDLERMTISREDAECLRLLVLDDFPVFGMGNRCLIAQQYVGVIELPDFAIEIMPKIYGEVSYESLREVLMRMLLVSNQTSSVRKLQSSVSVVKSSFAEMLIETFLNSMKSYATDGLLHDYQKRSRNLDKVKGRILFNRQVSKNILNPTRFYCRYSSYEFDTEINRFLACALRHARNMSHDQHNVAAIDGLSLVFDGVSEVSRDAALGYNIEFNSVNERASDAYLLGRLILESMAATTTAGGVEMFTMLFDMNLLYERFMYRVCRLIYGRKVTYQKRGVYLVRRASDGRKLIRLRPDLTLSTLDGSWVLDTKWKTPRGFAKESDVYQMNAYATGIRNVRRVVLLYPKVSSTSRMVGEYTLVKNEEVSGCQLDIRVIDLALCLNWYEFLDSVERAIGNPELVSVTTAS